jgi:hypothetical protein
MAGKKEHLTPKVGFAMAADLSRKYLKARYNIMFTGMPGIGKTAMIKMVALEMKYDLEIFHPVISDPTDFKGMPWIFQDKDGKTHCVFVAFDQLKRLTEATRPVICFLDDFGQAPVAVQAACMQLLHGGEIAGRKLSKHVRFAACTNRKQDRAGVSGILEPVKSRFHGIFELVPELDPWITFAVTVGISPMLVAFMRHRPGWLNGGDEGWSPVSDIVNQPCPRTIEHLSDVVNMGFDKVVRPSAYAGAVGKGMANEFYAFEQLVVRMPDIDVVLANPNGAEIPSSPDICYAMIGALHSRMDRANLGNIYKYIDRAFSKELQAVFHFDVVKFNGNLNHHAAYIKFATDNGDLFTN